MDMMVALYRSATHCAVTLDSATRQILVINHSFMKHSVSSLLLAFIYLNPKKYPLRAAPHRIGHGEGVPSPSPEMIHLLTHEVGKIQKMARRKLEVEEKKHTKVPIPASLLNKIFIAIPKKYY